jgi:hypothetical protein
VITRPERRILGCSSLASSTISCTGPLSRITGKPDHSLADDARSQTGSAHEEHRRNLGGGIVFWLLK